MKRTVLIAPVAQADEGEMDTVFRHLLPVDDPLMVGNVDAGDAGPGGAGEKAEVIVSKLFVGGGGTGHPGGLNCGLGFGLRFRLRQQQNDTDHHSQHR